VKKKSGIAALFFVLFSQRNFEQEYAVEYFIFYGSVRFAFI